MSPVSQDELQKRVERLEGATKPNALSTFITSLGRPNLELRKPISVTIISEGDEFTASFMDANISTGGGSVQEALYNLQCLIADFYLDDAEPNDLLSPQMRHQRQVLAECICRTSPKPTPSE